MIAGDDDDDNGVEKIDTTVSERERMILIL